MCKQPIMIKNKTKYLNTKYGQPYYIWVNCGKCNECRQQKQLEWNFRTYMQTIECLKENENNYIYFDTLTYRNKDLPRLTNFIETNKNWACFNYKDIRYFYETLRQNIGDKTFKYFIVSEYGELRNRPHYHIMLFVQGEKIKPIQLSQEVSKAWKFGRTDGMPYKTKKYVLEHNTIKSINLDCIRYVAKYVSKQQTFMEIIDKKWKQLEKYYEKSKFDKIKMKKIKRTYYRLMTPFHRQSQHFGEYGLNQINYKELYLTNRIYYKNDDLKIVQYLTLPMYYKRKLFQEQIKYNEKRIWINNEKGIEYNNIIENHNIEKITDRLKDLNKQLEYNYKETELNECAKYIYKQRGRFNGITDYKQHLEETELYQYNTDKDLKYIGFNTISKKYAGNDKQGYITTDIEQTELPQTQYIQEYENIINNLIKNKNDKKLVLLKEHLNEIYKNYFKI